MTGILVKSNDNWVIRHTEAYPSPLRGFKVTEYPIYPYIDNTEIHKLAAMDIEFNLVVLEVEGIEYEFAQIVKL